MRRNKNIVVTATVMIAAPFELAQQAHGGTWRTIEMVRKAKRPLAIVSPDGAVTKEHWELQRWRIDKAVCSQRFFMEPCYASL